MSANRTEQETKVREEFCKYYADLKAENAREGATVNRAREWEFFIAHKVEEGHLPETARNWKCPR